MMNTAVATEILMPKLSDSMEEGTILSWLVEAGAEVATGEDLLEVETDKATMTVQAEASGVLEVLSEEGSTVAVGTPIARLGAGGPAVREPGEAAPEETPAPAPVPEPRVEQSPAEEPPLPATTRGATPLARRIARIHGVDLASLRGSGAGGRVTKADVRAAAAGLAEPGPASSPRVEPEMPASTAASPAPVEGAKGESTIREPSRLQQVIARRMAESKGTVPHFQVETEVRMDTAIALRDELKAVAAGAPAPSFNDIVVRAAALALRRHPKANGSYVDGVFELHDRVNVGIAVAAEESLVVPTIVDADQKSLGEIGRESRRLVERVRSGEITPPELAGGTFTVSNLGMFGMTAIYPVVNLPQAAILGVGMTRHLLVRGADGEIEDAALMTLTLSCDHRMLYGAEAAGFLAEIRDLLEAPLGMAL